MRVIIFLFILFFPLFSLAEAKQPQTHEFQLDNGLRVIVREDHRTPTVVSQVWYKVGSSYEHGGITGISHVLEHMMFKGTPTYPQGELERLMADIGARQNATTGQDVTFYYQEIPADKLELSFQLESDRMRHLLLDPKEFSKEIKVVMEERRLSTEDNPQRTLYERFTAAAFVSSPYHHPVVGWMDDLKNKTIADLKGWYQRWYAPNNATVVVVGDVDPENVRQLATKYFGPLKASPISAIKPQVDIEPLGERLLDVNAPAQLPMLLMGYNVPSLLTAKSPPDSYALEVAAAILSGGASARLPKDLVRGQQLATDVFGSYNLYSRLSTVFLLGGTPAPGHTALALKHALLAHIKRLQTEPVTKAELDRIKAQVLAEKVYQRDSIVGQANEIGSLESIGLSWKTANEYADKIRAVTPEQIQAVTKRYLIPDRLTTATLNPQRQPSSKEPS
ncbi:MAG: M16 family metallopeptidase [Gammaproteobacteria bacterium]